MKVLITKRVHCGLTIPDGKSLTIDGFTFLPDFEGERVARHIQTVLDVNTKEEASSMASKVFGDFFAKLTLIDNSKYLLGDELSVSEVGGATTTHSISISVSAFIVQDGNIVKGIYEKDIETKRLRIRPLRLYRDGVNTNDSFQKYLNFYRVLECYLHSRASINDWIIRHERKVMMKKNNRDQDITIYTWIRIKLSHSKNNREDLTPFLISNPKHVFVVSKYLPKIQELARQIIKGRERLKHLSV